MTTNIQDKENDLGSLWLLKEKFGFKQIPLDIARETYLK
jgi:hypothetical protein